MLHDFVYLESSSPSPTCRHMGRCSLSLYLDGCASCDFAESGLERSDLVNLATAELFQPALRPSGSGRSLRSARRNR
jgi:hypothetical protein